MKSARKLNVLANLRRQARGAATLAAALAVSLPCAAATTIDSSDWGTVVAPVFGTSQSGVYAGAELFAGPNQFGNYFSGVLPNGRKVVPAGTTIQIGMNPLGAALTPDGKYLITSNDDERNGGLVSLINPINQGAYSLSVIDTSTMTVVSQISTAGKLFIGMQATGAGPYTIYASGGGDNSVKTFTVTGGVIAAGPAIAIAPIHSATEGFANNYTAAPPLTTSTVTPVGYSNNTHISFPAGSALSPNGRYLYVACNGDNSLAIIDTTTNTVVKQLPVGYFPYGVSVSPDGSKVYVADWGVQDYRFVHPTYDANGHLIAIGTTPNNQPDGFYVPVTSDKSSTISIIGVPNGTDVAHAALLREEHLGHQLDALFNIGDTHPSASTIVNGTLYVTKTNSDAISILSLATNRVAATFDLAPIHVNGLLSHQVHGSYPNAIVASADGTRVYVAEAGLNTVAILDTTSVLSPKLVGRIPTDWYPTGLALSADGATLYILNAKGIGEDINPHTNTTVSPFPTGIQSFSDSNFLFGTAQKVDVTPATTHYDNATALSYNFQTVDPSTLDTSVVPVGGAASTKIKHVFMILHENKTFDSVLGNQSGHFGSYASTTFNAPNGAPVVNGQYTGVTLNTQLLADTFAAGVNYYSDSEESDAGHQFATSGTATDYTEKTLLVKTGRGSLVNKNFDAEDYPEGGYIYNNAARNGVSFKTYGMNIRIAGNDSGGSAPAIVNDPLSGFLGYPTLTGPNVNIPLQNSGDTADPNEINPPFAPGDPRLSNAHTSGLGQSYFLKIPALAILDTLNPNGERRRDPVYPGYNFNISDQRRAKEFIADFDRQVAAGTLPEFIYIYQPNDHTGSVQAPNAGVVGHSALQQVADGDVGLGMVVSHIMNSPVYYDAGTGTGSAIFMTYDDAQSSQDHIHQHRTPVLVISPFAKPGYIGKRHTNTASIVKTAELLLGLPPNNDGDLFATDLRDYFQSSYNGITAASLTFTRTAHYTPSPESNRIWALVKNLDTSAPDQDSRRLGALHRLIVAADALHTAAVKQHQLRTAKYKASQNHLYQLALEVAKQPAQRDSDD